MSDGVPYLDIVLLAMIAGFLALRLISVLGRRTGHEPQESPSPSQTRGEEDAQQKRVTGDDADPWRRIDVDPESDLGRALSDIAARDRRFDPEVFLSNARAAYEMIIRAFAEGDRDTLKDLLSDEVYTRFEAAIADREEKSETWITDIVETGDTRFEDAEILDGTAEITIRFESEMVRVVRDSENRVVGGNPSDAEHVVDLWTFARKLGGRDPNWLLVATESLT